MLLRFALLVSGIYAASASPARKCVVKSLNDPAKSDVPAIHEAFQKCGRGGLIVFASNTTYHVNELLTITGCNGCEVQLEGTLLQSPNVQYWESVFLTHPFQDSRVTNRVKGVKNMLFHSLTGQGTIDGSGQPWYDAAMGTPAMKRPILWTTLDSTNVVFDKIKLRNSPNWFNFVVNSTNIVFNRLDIAATTTNATSILRNNDGFDTYQSDGITISNLVFNSKDDCVSFKPNSTNVLVENAWCAGSHGVSVGSLAQYPGVYDIVANITVRNVTFADHPVSKAHTAQGVRIKTWPGGYGSGEVHNVTYEDIKINSVDTPIMLDTCYFNTPEYCAENPAQLTVWDVTIKNVTGTSSGKYGDRVASLICTPGVRCELELSEIDLHPPSGAEGAYICQNTQPDIGVPCTSA